MGLTERQFYALTPRKYWMLLREHREKLREQQWLTGVIAAAIANWGVRAPEEALQPKHFALPLLQTREKRKRINRKQIAAQIRAQFDGAIAAQKATALHPPRDV